LGLGDFKYFPAESSPAVKLSSLYLTDDRLAAGDIHLRLQKIGHPAARAFFLPALARDPAATQRWIDAGETYWVAGDLKTAEYAYLRAAALGPGDPDTLLAVGDYFANQRDAERAIPYLARLLEIGRAGAEDDKILVNNLFVYYDTFGLATPAGINKGLLARALPDKLSAQQWLTYLMSGNPPSGTPDPAVVRRTWQWMHGKDFVDDKTEVEYTHYLIQHDMMAAAHEDWAAHFAPRQDGFPAQNRVFNGDFEYETTNGDFDWRFDERKGQKFERDRTRSMKGHYSLRVELEANDNPELNAAVQTVLLRPGNYRLEGFLRTGSITSSEGVRLAVHAEKGGTLLAETEGLTGTNDWKRATADFTVPAGEDRVRVALSRHRSLRIDNQLTGTVWLDAVQITAR
jgi:tetratricopeptide (TPR) repeat protein